MTVENKPAEQVKLFIKNTNDEYVLNGTTKCLHALTHESSGLQKLTM